MDLDNESDQRCSLVQGVLEGWSVSDDRAEWQGAGFESAKSHRIVNSDVQLGFSMKYDEFRGFAEFDWQIFETCWYNRLGPVQPDSKHW